MNVKKDERFVTGKERGSTKEDRILTEEECLEVLRGERDVPILNRRLKDYGEVTYVLENSNQKEYADPKRMR